MTIILTLVWARSVPMPPNPQEPTEMASESLRYVSRLYRSSVWLIILTLVWSRFVHSPSKRREMLFQLKLRNVNALVRLLSESCPNIRRFPRIREVEPFRPPVSRVASKSVLLMVFSVPRQCRGYLEASIGFPATFESLTDFASRWVAEAPSTLQLNPGN